MKKLILASLITLSIGQATAQTSQWGTPTGNPKFPKGTYTELPDPKPANQSNPAALATWAKVSATHAAWISTDYRAPKNEAPTSSLIKKTQTLTAWRGERIGAQALVWSSVAIDSLSFCLSPMVSGKNEIQASAAAVRYVMQDNFSTCGFRGQIDKWDSTLVADPIDHLAKSIDMQARTARPLWVTIKVPRTASVGEYTGTLTIKNGTHTIAALPIKLKVLDRTLPLPKEWAFHLDMWQNPFAEARYAGVEPFTEEHLELMRPGLELLRDAGQKVITTSIMHKPWGGQTEDYFESMISWIKRSNGEWVFDYTTFDTWVEYMIGLGIDRQIACYTMIPWKMSFKYYDQRTNSMQLLTTTTATEEYRQVWTALLRSLAAHLKEKGWFERTVIAMDERPTRDMQNAFAVIKAADPDFKVSLAGGNHPEIEAELYDYSMASDNLFSPEILAERRAKGFKSTYYTCCAQKYPNMFTYSPPAQAEWIGWFAAAKNYDGYLRWAYNSYTKEPLLDARFRAFQSGDSYMIYPQGRSSIRWEKLIDGVEAFEKIRMLRAQAAASKDQKLNRRLDEILAMFSLSHFETQPDPATILTKARKAIDALGEL